MEVVLGLEVGDRVEVVVRDVAGVVREAAEQQRRARRAAHRLRRDVVLEEGALVAEARPQVWHVREAVVLPIVVEVVRHDPYEVVPVRGDARMRAHQHGRLY